jgi:metallo-beta-lactamase family protein
VALEIAEDRGSEKKVTTLAFTGDLGRKGAAVVRDPETIERADVLITESTYGGRSHGPMNEARKNLARVVSQTANNGGLLIIPAFAVGRTQDVVYHLHELMESKEIPSMPVYVDSPLATNITEIFRQHPECFDEETEQLLMQDGGRDPFGFNMLKYTRSTEESKKLNDIRRPAIIISASGMCEGGRVLHHLRRNIGDPKTTVLFVGFQAENTLGRKLLGGDKTARIYGEEYQVRARMEAIDGYSAHADEGELLDFIAAIPNKPQHVFVVHGEPDATAAMAAGLARLGIENVTIPERGERFEV